MNDAERVAFIQSQVCCALIELEAMKAENAAAIAAGKEPVYGPDSFRGLESSYTIGHNDVIGYLSNYNVVVF